MNGVHSTLLSSASSANHVAKDFAELALADLNADDETSCRCSTTIRRHLADAAPLVSCTTISNRPPPTTVLWNSEDPGLLAAPDSWSSAT